MNDALPFAGIQPVRLVGASSKAPFCSIISEGKLIYASGNTIILQNTKNNQQKILYTHSLEGQVQLIVHHVTLYNQHLLAIAVRDSATLMNVIVVVALNSAIFNLQLKKDTQQLYYLRHVQQYEQIKAIHFFQEGTLLGIVSAYGSISSFSMMRTSNTDVLLHESYPHTAIFMGGLCLNKQTYVAVLLQEGRLGVRLCLMATDQLSRRLYYSLEVPENQEIISCRFQSQQEDSLFLLALTSKGDLLIYKVNDFATTLVTRIDVKVKPQGDQSLLGQQPLGMQTAGNKVLVYYVQSKTMTLIQFSNFNPSNYKLVVLRQTLQQYSNIRAVHSLRISRDTCTVAGLFRLNSKTLSAIPENQPTNKTLSLSLSLGQRKESVSETQVGGEYKGHEGYIALQMDILQNLIDYNDKKCNVEQTLSLFAGQAGVKKAQYCAHSNTLLLLLQNRVVKYYDLCPELTAKAKTQRVGSKLQLWASELVEQPNSIAAHPFNYSLVLVYNDIIKFHHYNCKNLFPPHIVASIKPTNFAAYSPLGDKLLLAHHSTLTVIDSYTYQTLKTISLSNQPLPSLSSSLKQAPSKAVSSIYFSSFEEVLVLMGQNSLSVVTGWQRSVAFGTFEGQSERIRQVAFDQVNKLAIVVQEQAILVFSRSTINNSKCSLVTKLQVQASSVLVVAELGVLFIGADDGSVLMVQWPHYQQQDLYYLRGSNRSYLFDEPIIALHVAPSMQYLYAISEKGSIAICHLLITDSEHVSPLYKKKLLKLSDIPLKLLNCWLISRTDEERKEREIIKLRGEQVDRTSQQAVFSQNHTSTCDEELELKKKEFEQNYAQEMKKYEEELGLQRLLQQIALVKDQIRVVRKQRERDLGNLNSLSDDQLNRHFQDRTNLEHQLNQLTLSSLAEKAQLKAQFNNQIQFLKQDFQTQNAIIQQKISETEAAESSTFNRVRLEGGVGEEDKQEQMELMRISFQEQKGQLLQTGQTIISRNRNTNIAIHNLQNKMGEIGLEKEKIEFDIYKVEMESQQMRSVLASLQETLHNNNIVYNRLMQKTRKQEAELHQERKLASRNEYTLNQLQQQITLLEQHQHYLDNLHQSVSAEFVAIRQHQQTADQSIEALSGQLMQLRAAKTKKNYEEGLAKTRWVQACKTLGRQLQLSEEQAVNRLKADLQDRQSEIEENKLGREFETLQADKQKMSMDANKWNQIKDSYRAGFRRNYRKLNDENLKLTYQYNDLLKVSQDYKTYLNYLTTGISNQLRAKDQPYSLPKFAKERRAKPAGSFSGVELKPGSRHKGIIKKSVCISLHQQSGKFITEA